MKLKKYLKQVADIVKSDIPDDDGYIYVSKFDGSYITRVGMEENAQFLADRGITKELSHGTGLSTLDGKWYGWSHRAIHGFHVGSTCKKGDCHYVPDSLDEYEKDAVRFWSDENHKNVKCKGIIEEGENKYFQIEWEYNDSTPNESLRGKISGCKHYIGPLGNGEWTAETIEDAKQMAIDFNRGVS